MDNSGKDGTIKHVISALNPASCNVLAFKEPTSEELAHDFLRRTHKALPPIGFVGVYNRSHYEDVIEIRIQKLLPKTDLSKRYDHINCFEKILTENRVKIIKFFLHISKEEQRSGSLKELRIQQKDGKKIHEIIKDEKNGKNI